MEVSSPRLINLLQKPGEAPQVWHSGKEQPFLSQSDLALLKDSEEFIDLVRAMRLSNVLNYAFDQVVKEVDKTSSAGRLAYTRSRLNLGGSLHEGIGLLENLSKRHQGKSYFSKARNTLEGLNKREKKNMRLLRNNAAFSFRSNQLQHERSR